MGSPTVNSSTEAPPSSSGAASLEFRAATKRYPGASQAAVDQLSLEVPAGEICILVGPSGCGKTTAMRMVNRLIDITEGDILLGGESVRSRNESDLRREIGYVIQQIGLFPHQTIGENISTVPRLLGWDKKRIRARVGELLELVSLPAEMRNSYPAQISGGQRQRVGVARALAADPPLMLMDEPFGAIDPINRDRLQNEFLRLQAEIRKTVVFVTHDIDEGIKMGDRIAILREGGRLAQYDTPENILSHPADEFVARFVGVDRGLKRLTLSELTDVDLIKPRTLTEASGAAQLTPEERDTAVIVDGDGRPIGRPRPLGRGAGGDGGKLYGEVAEPAGRGRGDGGMMAPLGPVARTTTSLRDALSLMLSNRQRLLVVVDGDGRLAGMASVELIGTALVRYGADGEGDGADPEAGGERADTRGVPA